MWEWLNNRVMNKTSAFKYFCLDISSAYKEEQIIFGHQCWSFTEDNNEMKTFNWHFKDSILNENEIYMTSEQICSIELFLLQFYSVNWQNTRRWCKPSLCPIAFVVFTVIPISVSLIKCEDLFQAWPLWIKIASMRLEAKQKKTLKFRSNHKYFYETFVSGINEKKVEIKLHISICVEKLLNEAPGCLDLYFYFLVFFPNVFEIFHWQIEFSHSKFHLLNTFLVISNRPPKHAISIYWKFLLRWSRTRKKHKYSIWK